MILPLRLDLNQAVLSPKKKGFRTLNRFRGCRRGCPAPGIARRGHSAMKLLTSLPRKPWNHWWAVTDSNRRHPACKADALPAELTALRQDLSLRDDGAQGRVGTFGCRRCSRWYPRVRAKAPRPCDFALGVRPRRFCARANTRRALTTRRASCVVGCLSGQ
jgi:hypothetical protein